MPWVQILNHAIYTEISLVVVFPPNSGDPFHYLGDKVLVLSIGTREN